MTDDQFWRLVITTVFIVAVGMAKPRIRSWLASRDGRRKK